MGKRLCWELGAQGWDSQGAGTWAELGRTGFPDFSDAVGELNSGIWENERLYTARVDCCGTRPRPTVPYHDVRIVGVPVNLVGHRGCVPVPATVWTFRCWAHGGVVMWCVLGARRRWRRHMPLSSYMWRAAAVRSLHTTNTHAPIYMYIRARSRRCPIHTGLLIYQMYFCQRLRSRFSARASLPLLGVTSHQVTVASIGQPHPPLPRRNHPKRWNPWG